jgi:hypothetical protein
MSRIDPLKATVWLVMTALCLWIWVVIATVIIRWLWT